MKVGIFSPYLETMGGGERYLLTVAEFFQDRGDAVDIFWSGDSDKTQLTRLFNLNLEKVKFVPDVFFNNVGLKDKLLVTTKYDLIFFLSDGSIPSSLATKNILHFQRPFNLPNQKTLFNKIKLSRFSTIVCNSKFTQRSIDQTFGVKSRVLYPPVDIKNFTPGKKENLILSVGRFFAPSNPKKQDILIDIFAKAVHTDFKNFKFVLVGSVTGDSQSAIAKLRTRAKNLPIQIICDASFPELKKLYSQAKFFWHAAGFGQDLQQHPDRAEHFGMSTVEAMSAGAVPIVFGAGGQLEIVEESVSGNFWQTPAELIKKTTALITNPRLTSEISKNAVLRAKDFSKEKFFQHLNEIL